jgi:hypothetical protein
MLSLLWYWLLFTVYCLLFTVYQYYVPCTDNIQYCVLLCWLGWKLKSISFLCFDLFWSCKLQFPDVQTETLSFLFICFPFLPAFFFEPHIFIIFISSSAVVGTTNKQTNNNAAANPSRYHTTTGSINTAHSTQHCWLRKQETRQPKRYQILSSQHSTA